MARYVATLALYFMSLQPSEIVKYLKVIWFKTMSYIDTYTAEVFCC